MATPSTEVHDQSSPGSLIAHQWDLVKSPRDSYPGSALAWPYDFGQANYSPHSVSPLSFPVNLDVSKTSLELKVYGLLKWE